MRGVKISPLPFLPSLELGRGSGSIPEEGAMKRERKTHEGAKHRGRLAFFDIAMTRKRKRK